MNNWEDNKLQRLKKAWEISDVNAIQDACLRGGLGNNDMRKTIWPSFLSPERSIDNWDKIPLENAYSEIIKRDIERSMYTLDIHKDLEEDARFLKRKDLSDIVNAVFAHDRDLHYFQGFHSICTIFYEVGGRDLGFAMSIGCAQRFIKDSMRESFDQGVFPEMLLIY